MPPRRRGASGHRGVHVHPSGSYSAEIRSGDVRLGLRTFDTAHEGARAYDAAAWRLRRSRWDMNLPDVATREQAQELAPPLAEMDEEAMALWCQRFPEDVINEQQKNKLN
ncbi:ethylene-responsive transcription factor ERF071-like [Aegilops tauschii subsp. strangulata]|uniref:ethylene-responsive transcription factor ERF071-like n=1 Tax=Aegilops tauschii subsp. strangulata TaxID=200361 RepID=UPI00098AEEA0|nr:ethylene-responsive transcription factor ERF105-like [Aegilops tauschii subsp. strangulata]